MAAALPPESSAVDSDGPSESSTRLQNAWETWTRKGYIAIAQLAVGTVAACAAIGAVWLVHQSNQRYENANRDHDLLTKARELIDSKDASLRVGGIDSLGQIATDSQTDRPMVLGMLAAYVRTHAPITACSVPSFPDKTVEVDVQAALTLIGQLGSERDNPIDLSNSCLRGANLENARLRWADLSGTNLNNATMYRVDLSAAKLTGTQLNGAAIAGGARLGWADLSSAVLTDAILRPPPETDLQNITYNADTAWPVGFTPPPSHG